MELTDSTANELTVAFTSIADVLQSFGAVVRNVAFVVLVLSASCALFIIISLFTQMTKYLQLQFHVTPTKASLIVGQCVVFENSFESPLLIHQRTADRVRKCCCRQSGERALKE